MVEAQEVAVGFTMVAPVKWLGNLTGQALSNVPCKFLSTDVCPVKFGESFELIPHTSDFRIWAKFLRKMLV